MNKKQLNAEIEFLLKQNKELYEKYNTLLSQTKEESKAFEEKLEMLSKENQELKSAIDELGQTTAVQEKAEETADENSEEKTVSLNLPNLNETAVSGEIAGREDLNIDYAARAIGEAVVLCTTLCGEFKSFDKTVSNDLINLALGKTEAFKSEIMEIAVSDVDNELKMAQINTKKSELIEYFELLKHQN